MKTNRKYIGTFFLCSFILIFILQNVYGIESTQQLGVLLSQSALTSSEGIQLSDAQKKQTVPQQDSTLHNMQSVVTFCCNHSYVLSGVGLALLVGSGLFRLYTWCSNDREKCDVKKPVVV